MDSAFRCGHRQAGHDSGVGSFAKAPKGILESNLIKRHRKILVNLHRGRSLFHANKAQNGGKNFGVFEHSNQSQGPHTLDLGSKNKGTTVGL